MTVSMPAYKKSAFAKSYPNSATALFINIFPLLYASIHRVIYLWKTQFSKKKNIKYYNLSTCLYCNRSTLWILVHILYVRLSQTVGAQQLIAYLSQHGLHGEITFRQVNTTTVEIRAKLETTLQYPDQVWSWSVRKFPIDYNDIDPESRCSLEKLGAQVVSFDEDLDYLVLPGNETATWYRDMTLIGECFTFIYYYISIKFLLL